MATFTMGEFIAEHGLGVNVNDSGATREIAKYLRQKGFERVKTREGYVWTDERGARLSQLQQKLRGIKL